MYEWAYIYAWTQYPAGLFKVLACRNPWIFLVWTSKMTKFAIFYLYLKQNEKNCFYYWMNTWKRPKICLKAYINYFDKAWAWFQPGPKNLGLTRVLNNFRSIQRNRQQLKKYYIPHIYQILEFIQLRDSWKCMSRWTASMMSRWSESMREKSRWTEGMMSRWTASMKWFLGEVSVWSPGELQV